MILEDHESSLNWQYNATFAEGGLRKDVVAYYDGSMRNRQNVTMTNTNEKVIAGESIYDYTGRPAIQVLPSPISSNYIRYSTNLNSADNQNPLKFDLIHFDIDDVTDSCMQTDAEAMLTNSSTSKYYSGNTYTVEGYQAFLPDAEGYPYSQIEYTSDNTGRVRRQGGVGKTFQLNSGHETVYLYGQPNQQEQIQVLSHSAEFLFFL